MSYSPLPVALGVLAAGAPVPPGYAGLLVTRDHGPDDDPTPALLEIDGHRQELAEGSWQVPVLPGPRTVALRTPGTLAGLAEARVTVPPGGRVELRFELAADRTRVYDARGREVGRVVRPPRTGSRPAALGAVLLLVVALVAAAVWFLTR